jgi:hypothetical protein
MLIDVWIMTVKNSHNKKWQFQRNVHHISCDIDFDFVFKLLDNGMLVMIYGFNASLVLQQLGLMSSTFKYIFIFIMHPNPNSESTL